MDKLLFDNANSMSDDAGAPPIYAALMALKPEGLSPNAWAIRAGVSRTVWADIRRHGNPTRKTLEKLLQAIDVPPSEFEARLRPVKTEVRGTGMTPQEVQEAWSLKNAKRVPLLGTAFGGEWSDDGNVEMTELRLAEILDYLARPPSLAGDDQAYALEIIGESMSPRYEPGEQVFVSPKAPVHIGDDVIVQLRANGDEHSDITDQVVEVLIKRLVRRTSTYYELRQFNPDMTFKVPVASVLRIHRVRGRL